MLYASARMESTSLEPCVTSTWSTGTPTCFANVAAISSRMGGTYHVCCAQLPISASFALGDMPKGFSLKFRRIGPAARRAVVTSRSIWSSSAEYGRPPPSTRDISDAGSRPGRATEAPRPRPVLRSHWRRERPERDSVLTIEPRGEWKGRAGGRTGDRANDSESEPIARGERARPDPLHCAPCRGNVGW